MFNIIKSSDRSENKKVKYNVTQWSEISLEHINILRSKVQ